MDGELVLDPEDDRMDEGNSDELPPEVQHFTIEPKATDKLEAVADYIDFAKLEQEYENPALSYRLLHMFEVCVNRRPEIAKFIERVHTKDNSMDYEFYRRFVTLLEKFKNASPSGQWIMADSQWLTSTEELSQASIERELANLKKAQDEGIKENIRVSMTKLFDAYLRSGKFYDAAKLYSRSLRDYCNAPRSVVPMLLNHVKVLMFMHDYHRVDTYLNQAERAIHDCQDRDVKYDRNNPLFPRDEKNTKAIAHQAVVDSAKVNAVMGITKMCHKNYLQAADKFVSVDHETFEFPGLISPTDVAYYGCFCALASYDRTQLKEKVLNNANFRKFMEPEGKLVDLIQAFRNNSFTTVFQLLEEMRPTLLLNMYIAAHQRQLYTLIRRRAFVQYISTFGVISLPTMAKVFRTETAQLIDELIDLIDYNYIEARIDPIGEKLYRLDENINKTNSERIMRIQKDLEERVRVMVTRGALAMNGVNPYKEYENEFEASGSGIFPRGNRRRAAQFDMDEEYDDDSEMNAKSFHQQYEQSAACSSSSISCWHWSSRK